MPGPFRSANRGSGVGDRLNGVSGFPDFNRGDAIWDVISRVVEFIVSTPVTYLQERFVGVIVL